MFKNIVFILILIICEKSFAQRPVMVDVDSKNDEVNSDYLMDDLSVKNFIQKLAKCISEEDLAGCESCFKTFNRRDVAIFFAEHRVNVNLIDFHIVANNGKEAEVALNYSMNVDRNIITFISFMNLKEINGEWKVVKEKICKRNWENPSCSNGRCGGVNVPRLIQQPKPVANCAGGQCGQNRIPMGVGNQIFPELEDF